MDKPRVVLVEWEDSAQALPKWQWLDDIEEPSIVRCQSVGWLVHEDGRELRLAVSLGGNDAEYQAAGIIAIPARSVLKVEPLINASSPSPIPLACQAAG